MYSIKEIFYTIQGEGGQARTPPWFVRFAGCNLWSGKEQDRRTGRRVARGWCDTDFLGTNGPSGGKYDTAQTVASSRSPARLWRWNTARLGRSSA